MSSTDLHIGIVASPDCNNEAQVLRLGIEYFGAKVTIFKIGRPLDLIKVLTGEIIDSSIKHLILSFHGSKGKILMPKLSKSLYFDSEPKNSFGIEEILKYGLLEKKIIISTGCTLGRKRIASAFLKTGVDTYIAPKGYVEANAALFFVMRFYYEIISNKSSVKNAFLSAYSSDNETAFFSYYTG